MPAARTYWFGDLGDPTIRVVVATDAQRDELQAFLNANFEALVDQVGLPPLLVGLGVESQETVDRDYGGKWPYYDDPRYFER